jgi:hypothetical protein
MWPFRSVELRVGHTNKIWSTAQGRFGHPTRVNGVQYALALFNGRNVNQ